MFKLPPKGNVVSCSTCGYTWIRGMSGDHSCVATLSATLNRAKWLIGQVYNDLPSRRDWLDPHLEQEMKEFSENKL